MLSKRSKDSDTDPSTPEALRSADTDPGLGPSSAPATKRGLGDVAPAMTPSAVPVKAKVGAKKDSVEVLLAGMANPQPEKPRTTPQTAGQSSAAYHAEHSVRPGRTTADEGPKVVVERPPQNPTVRIDRTKLAAMMQAAPPPKVDGLPLSVRIGVALVAGLTVVLVIFVMARSSGIDRATHGSSVTASPAPPPGTREPVPSAAPPVVQPAVSASPAPAASVNNPFASAPAASSEMAPASTSATMAPASPKPRTRPAGPQPPPTHSVDLSEFKTTFH